jgi:hypothetical protein
MVICKKVFLHQRRLGGGLFHRHASGDGRGREAPRDQPHRILYRVPFATSATLPRLLASYGPTGRPGTCDAASAARTGSIAGSGAFIAGTRNPAGSAIFTRNAGGRVNEWRCATSAGAISRWSPALRPHPPKSLRFRIVPPFTWMDSRRGKDIRARHSPPPRRASSASLYGREMKHETEAKAGNSGRP